MDASQLDQDLTRPHVSNRVLQGFLLFLSEKHGAEFAESVVVEAGLPVDYLRDSLGWVSSVYVHRFTSVLLKRLFNLDQYPPYSHPAWQLWREEGRIALRRDQIGPVWPMFRFLGSPAMFFRMIPSVSASANRITRFELLRQAPGLTEIRAGPSDGAPPDAPQFCWNRIGFLEAIPPVWGYPRARVEHVECIHRRVSPAKACLYRVHYSDRWLMRAARDLFPGIVAGGIAWGGALALRPELAIVGATCGAATGFAVDAWFRNRQLQSDARRQDEHLTRVYTETDERYIDLWEERQALRRSLLANSKISGYLAASLVEQIMQDPEVEVRMGGTLIRAAVMFIDIVAYTPRCESESPERVVQELNTYFSHMDPVIDSHNGVIDKRMGDGMMIVFVHQDGEDPADLSPVGRRATGCAINLLRALDECNKELARHGAAPMQIRLGLSSGELVRGNLGSEVRLEYTVIGDVVNLAARLEAQATPGCVLVSKELAEYLPPDATRTSSRVTRVKGKDQPVEVVEATLAAK